MFCIYRDSLKVHRTSQPLPTRGFRGKPEIAALAASAAIATAGVDFSKQVYISPNSKRA